MWQTWAKSSVCHRQVPSDRELVARTARNEYRPLRHDLLGIVAGFLSHRELCIAELVNRYWAEAACAAWVSLAKEGQFFAADRDISCKQYIATLYQFGADGWRNALKVDLGIIPNLSSSECQKLSMPDPWDETKTVGDTSVFLYLPSVVTATVINSSLQLAAPAIPGQALALVKRPHVIVGTRLLQIPVTLRNLGMLFQEQCPEMPQTGYEGLCRKDVLTQHGDVQVAAPGWRLLRKEIVERNQLYSQQKIAVEEKKWSLVPLIERVCLNLLMRINQQHFCDDVNSRARTSTLTWHVMRPPFPSLSVPTSILLWDGAISKRLGFSCELSTQSDIIGVAVGLPIG